jgi:hypothetical protein
LKSGIDVHLIEAPQQRLGIAPSRFLSGQLATARIACWPRSEHKNTVGGHRRDQTHLRTFGNRRPSEQAKNQPSGPAKPAEPRFQNFGAAQRSEAAPSDSVNASKKA